MGKVHRHSFAENEVEVAVAFRLLLAVSRPWLRIDFSDVNVAYR